MGQNKVWAEIMRNTAIGTDVVEGVRVNTTKRGDFSLGLRVPSRPTFSFPEGTRFRWAKQLLMRLFRIYTRYQFRFNDWIVEVVADEFGALTTIESAISTLQAEQDRFVNEAETNAALQDALRILDRRISSSEHSLEDVRRETYALGAMREQLNEAFCKMANIESAVAQQRDRHEDQLANVLEQVKVLADLHARASDELTALGSRLDVVGEQTSEARLEQEQSVDLLLNSVVAHDGLVASEGLWFNPPIVIGFEHRVAKLRAVTERILEHGFVIKNALALLEKGGSVLDVGCAESVLPLELASHGFMVHGVDVRSYPVNHRNLISYEGDFLDIDFPEQSFDMVVFLSSIEHFGLGWYGDPRDATADRKSLRKASQLLRDSGHLVITVPVSERMHVTNVQRVYEIDYFENELSNAGFTVLERLIGRKVDRRQWVIHDGQGPLREGVLMAVCRKGEV